MGISVTVVVLLLAAAAAVVIPKLSHPLTYHGRRITDASQVLADTQRNVRAMVRRRHGTDSGRTRCYFLQPAQQPAGAEKTDVLSSIVCGPVLFVGGHIGQEYLRFDLRSRSTSGGTVTLAAASTPVSNQPGSLPAGYVLQRPDGLHPPTGNGGLSVPPPPPAPANELISTSLGSQNLPAAPSDAIIGSLHGGLRLANLGVISRYGHFDTARRAPAGQKLIAFGVTAYIDNAGSLKSLLGSTAVSVDGKKGRKLPAATFPDYVVAVPKAATSVNLVVTDAGYTQTISLLTGQPGPHNLAVLARADRFDPLNQVKNMTLKYSPAVAGPKGKPETSQVVSVTVGYVALGFWAGPDQRPAPSPSMAWMLPDYSVTNPKQPGHTFSLPATVMTFTPAGGSPVTATDLVSTADTSLNAFVVPALLTSGTLTISGAFSIPSNKGKRSIAVTITPPVSFTVTFLQ